MSLHTVKYIAKYEMRTLLRSWFFRIFAGLIIIGLTIFNIAMNVASSGAPWIYKALDASIPYANLIILNLGQAIVAVFLSSEFMKHDRKNDTVEVIYSRSMSNGDYILGKALGILSVFLVLNIIVLALGIGLSFISSSTSGNIMPLLVYPLLISLPTLVFILGLSFFTMTFLKNQAITFILLLGYIAVSVFYLNRKAYHVFDFIAYYVPMMHSSFGGFGNLHEIIIHRGIYLLLGISFVFFTIYKLNRLPQTKWFVSLPLISALLFLVAGVFMVFNYISGKENDYNFKQQLITYNNRYCNYPRVFVSEYTLDAAHLGDKLSVNSTMVVHNRSLVNMDTMVFSLNPSLHISGVFINGAKAKYTRIQHLVMLVNDKPFVPGDSMVVQLDYSGVIDERVCFVDLNSPDYKDFFNMEVFNIRKRSAWITDDFVCLNPSSLWYPVAGTGYASEKPLFHTSGMAKFKLHVKTRPGLTAISQGELKSQGKGSYNFVTEYPLPSISLIIGDYKKYSVVSDSVTFTLYSRKGNQFFEPVFKDIKDTIPVLLKELKVEYEKNINISYPFSRFQMVEVPLHFALDRHLWSFSSDAVQPEMLLYPEKGVIMWDTDFRFRKYREERGMKRNNEEVSPKELQSRMLKQFVRRNIINRWSPDSEYDGLITASTYNIFPNYFSFVTPFLFENRPELTIGFESFFNDRGSSASSNRSLGWMENMSLEEWAITKLKQSSLENIIKANIAGDKNALKTEEIQKIALAKGRQFFDIIESKYGKGKFDIAINELVANNKNKEISYSQVKNVFQNNFGIDLDKEIFKWYSGKDLPGFIVSGVKTYKVVKDEKTLYQVKFNVSNPENSDGCFIVNVELKNANRDRNRWGGESVSADFSKKYFIPAKSARELGLTFSTEPARMGIYTFISQNLPNTYVVNYNGFTDTYKGEALDTIQAIDPLSIMPDKNEIIVDNEDPGFFIKQVDDQPFLKSIVNKKMKSSNVYSYLNYWSPPSKWTPVLRTEFYGRYIHSGVYIKPGAGEKKVEWKTKLPGSGHYDVYCYIPKFSFYYWRRNNNRTDYNFTVISDEGSQQVVIDYDEADSGWNLLGSYYFSADTARVEFSDKSSGAILYADAIKWVKSK